MVAGVSPFVPELWRRAGRETDSSGFPATIGTVPLRLVHLRLDSTLRASNRAVTTGKPARALPLFFSECEVGDPHGAGLVPQDKLDRVLGGEVLRLKVVLILLPLSGQGDVSMQTDVMPVGLIDPRTIRRGASALARNRTV